MSPAGERCLFLGEDAKVHRGWLEIRLDGRIYEMACDATPLRPLWKDAKFFVDDPRRRCDDCYPYTDKEEQQ